MLRKWNRVLAFILAFALVATTFNSDLASVRVFADDAPEETVEQPAEEAPQQESGGEEAQPENNGGEYQEEGGQEITPPSEEPGQNPVEEPKQNADQQNPAEEPAQNPPAENPNPPAVEPATPDAESTDVVIPEEPKEAAATESSFDKEKEDAASESSSKEDAAAEASSEDDAATEASSEDKEEKENFITIKYVATEGGSVTKSEEKLNADEEEPKIEGSTAVADDGFVFVSWKDADGEVVSESAEYIPSSVVEDITFTANFKKAEVEIEMPAQRFNGYAGGVSVYVEAEEGAFPKGTVLEVSEVNDLNVLEKAADAVDGTVKEAKAVDITFRYNGEEIQPAKQIKVKLTTTAIENPDDTSVVHIDDAGNADVVDSEVKGITAEILTDSFSIYVVVSEGADARLLVHFMNGEEEIASMYVKKDDDMETVIYDPGVGTQAEGINFKGWSENEDYDVNAEAMTIQQVREDIVNILEAGIVEGTNVNYYAVFSKMYIVTYLDENGASLGQKQVEFKADATGDDLKQEYEVNMAYTPTSDECNFMGWTVKEGKNNIVEKEGEVYTYNDDDIFENEDNITIVGDVVFSVNAPRGHWLVFNENGKGGKYNAPQFVKTGNVTARPCEDSEMTRFGYTFSGWFEAVEDAETDPEAEPQEGEAQEKEIVLRDEPFVFGQELEKNTTIYAKWTPNETAAYTVILWTQNIDRDGYDLKEAYIQNDGVVGENIPYEIVANGDEGYVKIGNNKNVEKHYKGFNVRTSIADVKIVPEGNSVLNIYFDRIEYDLKFYYYRHRTVREGRVDKDEFSYANNSAAGQNTWGIVSWHTSDTSHPTQTYGADNVENIDGYEGHYFILHAYYGENIEGRWPQYSQITGVGNNSPVSFVMMNGTGLKPNPSSGGDGTIKGNITILDEKILGATNDADGNFLIVRFQTYNNWNYHIWYEAVPGEDYTGKPTHTYEGVTYYEDHIVTPRSSNTDVNQQNAPQYTGYEYYTRRNEDWTNSSRWSTNNPTIYHINYLYKRLSYPVQFMDGKYVDGNGNLIEGNDQFNIKSSDPIDQGTAIPDEVKNYKPELQGGRKGFVFEGWYTDSTCTTEYSFTGKMPVGGIIVYAKWRQVEYRVFLHPNVDESDTSLEWGSEEQAMNFRVAYGGKVSTPTGTRDDYLFVGWYFDEGFTRVFNSSAYVLNETTVTTDYDKTTHMTDDTNKYGNGATYNKDLDRFWITKELNLYAKWRKILNGADGIKVQYTLKDPAIETPGTGTPVDNNEYVDNANAIAVPAITAPEGYVFDHWVMQTWNGTAYEDADSTPIYPGQEYKILAANAHIVVIKENEQGEIEEASYTIQLRPSFKEKETATPTFIPWFMNDGSYAFRIDNATDYLASTLKINEAVNMAGAQTRTGYKFVGWRRVDMGESFQEAKDFMGDSGNWQKTDLTAEFFYNEEDGKYYQNNEFTGDAVAQVAADEDKPYQAMFAVWERTAMDVTADSYEGTYDAEYHYITVHPSVEEDSIIYYSRDNQNWSTANIGVKDVSEGLVTVYVKVENPYYETVTTQATVKIKPRPVEVKANDASKVFGTNDPQFTASVSGVIDNAEIEYDLNRPGKGTDEAVGTYPNAIVASGEEAQGNYTVTYKPGNFEIKKAGTNIITAAPYSGIYDAAAHSITVSGGAEGTTFQYRTSEDQQWSDELPTFTNVNVDNPATVYVKGSNPNYDDTFAEATVTIDYRPVTVTAKNASKIYGADDPEFEAVTGENQLLGEDTVEYQLRRNGDDEEVGTYIGVIEPYGEEIQGNYKVTYIKADFSITKAATLSVTGISYENYYDGESHSVKATASVVEGTTIYFSEDNITWSTEAPKYKNITTDEPSGSITTYIKAENPNYETATDVATVTIKPLTVTVKADNASKVYGDPDPAKFTATVTGIKDGDEITYEVTRKGTGTEEGPAEDVGYYEGDLIPSGDVKQGNYNVEYIPGDFEITKAPADKLGLTAENYNGKYDGQPHTITVTVTEEEGTTLYFSLDNENFVTDLSEYEYTNVTEEAITIFVKAENDNYEMATASATVMITPRIITVTAGSSEDHEYDGTEVEVTDYTISGDDLVEGQTLTAELENNKRTLPGSQIVNIKEGSVLITSDGEITTDNYTITLQPGTLTIKDRTNPYEITIANDDIIIDYDGNLHRYVSGYSINPDENTTILDWIWDALSNMFTLKASAAEDITFDIDGVTYTIDGVIISAEGTEVGTYDFTHIGNPVISKDGVDVTKQFKVNYKLGRLIIQGTQPGPTPDPTPDPTPTPIPDDPTPTAPTPAPAPAPAAIAPAGEAVLGARRDSGQAVLGARRARTEDSTNLPARLLVILAAAAASATLLLIGKRKEEEED